MIIFTNRLFIYVFILTAKTIQKFEAMNQNCSKFPNYGWGKIAVFTDIHVHIKSADFPELDTASFIKFDRLSFPSVFMYFWLN